MTTATIAPNKALLTLQCTPAALKHIREKLAIEPEATALRIRLAKKGCTQFVYQFTCGVVCNADERECRTKEGLVVFLQEQYLDFFQGATLDYVTSGLDKKLTFLNPNEGARCGCGESFNIVHRSDAIS
jgi:iron-sulfur cluster assembly protein